MAWLHRAQLARRLAIVTRAARRNASHRETLRAHATACAAIRAALAEAGLDPADVSCLGFGDRAAPELLALGDTPELQRADAAFAAADLRLSSGESLAAKAARLAPRFASGPPPPPGASLLDWLAWASARGGGDPGGATTQAEKK